MKKRIMVALLTAGMTLSLFAGCGASDKDSSASSANTSIEKSSSVVSESKAESKEEAKSNSEINVGVALCSTTTEYWSRVADGVNSKAEELGINVTLVAPSSETDVTGQISNLEDMIAAGMDAICCGPCDSTTVGGTLETAIDAGIPVIIVDTDVKDIDRSAFVGISQAEAAYETKPYVEEAVGKGFKAALIGGIQGHEATTGRLEGFTNICNDLDGEVIETQYGDWTSDTAMTITEAYLAKYGEGELDVIMCASDNTALGAVSAVEAAGRTDVKVVGFDGNESAVQAVIDGRMVATVSQDGKAIGEAIVETLYTWATGGKTDEYVLVDCVGIGPDNAKDFL